MVHTFAGAAGWSIDDVIEYRALIHNIMVTGRVSGDRTGTGTLRVHGALLRFPDVGVKFPLVTIKRTPFRLAAEEILWMLRGETNVRTLQDKGIRIWDQWARPDGELGPVYGAQWRRWNSPYHGVPMDQVAIAQDMIRRDPLSRRIIVTGWNPGEIDDMALPPCHTTHQYTVMEGRLNLFLYMRSVDVFLGLPFNIAGYALMLNLMARTCSLEPGKLVIAACDAHLYRNHLEQAQTIVTRIPMSPPQLIVHTRRDNIWEYTMDDFHLSGYQSYPALKGDVSV